MSALVIQFLPESANDDSPQPRVSGPAVCLGCRHEWRVTAPPGMMDEFVCPACGTHKGVRVGLIWPAGEMWVCRCGSTVFSLPRSGAPICVACGLRATGWVDDGGAPDEQA